MMFQHNNTPASSFTETPALSSSAPPSRKPFPVRFEQNEAFISGMVETAAVQGEPLFGEEALFLTMRSTRLSGTHDHIPLCIPLDVAHRHNISLHVGDLLVVSGQVRTYFSPSLQRMQTVVYAALAVNANHDPGVNSIRLTGEVTRVPTYNVTPFGRELTIANICVPYSTPAYRDVAHLPVMFWGSFASVAQTYKPRETIHVFGRFQSRDYQKTLPDGTVEQRIAHEISCHHCTPIERNFASHRSIL